VTVVKLGQHARKMFTKTAVIVNSCIR